MMIQCAGCGAEGHAGEYGHTDNAGEVYCGFCWADMVVHRPVHPFEKKQVRSLAKQEETKVAKKTRAVAKTVVSEKDFGASVIDAEKALRGCKTADDVRGAWKKHYLVIGHKAMGRLLVGKKAKTLISKRQERLAKTS